MHDQVRLCGVVRDEVDSKIMWTIHAFVHHEYAGLDQGTFTGFEDHRTDSQFGGSTALQNLDVRGLLETQCAIPVVGDLDGEGFLNIEFHITIID